jgi:hypothetical protein
MAACYTASMGRALDGISHAVGPCLVPVARAHAPVPFPLRRAALGKQMHRVPRVCTYGRMLIRPACVICCRAVQQCDKRKKVTLTPEDILEALREAEFEDFEQPMKDALTQFRNGGASSGKKGGSGAKKQKLDDSANGADTPTRPDQDSKEGEDGTGEAAGSAEADDKMQDEADQDLAKDSAEKDDDEKQGAADGVGTDATGENS